MGTQLQTTDMSLPLGNLDAYILRVNHIPMLTLEEEQNLATRLQNNQDLQAAQRLVMSHLRFVVKIAKGYAGYGLSQSDLIQEGNVGLMKAVKRFNPEMGVRLVSFAVHWIKAEIHEFILKNYRIAKIATTKAQRKLFFNIRQTKKHLGWFTKQEAEQLAKDLNVKPKTVIEMEGRMHSGDTSFDADVNDDDSSSFAPSQYLEDHSFDPALLVESNNSETSHHERLVSALEKLDARSKIILQRRWLSEQKSTLQELAAEFDVSAERIRQLEQQALDKLKSTCNNA